MHRITSQIGENRLGHTLQVPILRNDGHSRLDESFRDERSCAGEARTRRCLGQQTLSNGFARTILVFVLKNPMNAKHPRLNPDWKR
jgi:hypothetical protein